MLPKKKGMKKMTSNKTKWLLDELLLNCPEISQEEREEIIEKI